MENEIRQHLDQLEKVAINMAVHRVGLLLAKVTKHTEAAFERAKRKDPETRQKLLDVLNKHPDCLEVILAESVNAMLYRIVSSLEVSEDGKTISLNFDGEHLLEDTRN